MFTISFLPSTKIMPAQKRYPWAAAKKDPQPKPKYLPQKTKAKLLSSPEHKEDENLNGGESAAPAASSADVQSQGAEAVYCETQRSVVRQQKEHRATIEDCSPELRDIIEMATHRYRIGAGDLRWLAWNSSHWTNRSNSSKHRASSSWAGGHFYSM